MSEYVKANKVPFPSISAGSLLFFHCKKESAVIIADSQRMLNNDTKTPIKYLNYIYIFIFTL